MHSAVVVAPVAVADTVVVAVVPRHASQEQKADCRQHYAVDVAVALLHRYVVVADLVAPVVAVIAVATD